eukprot:TRINITY_DN4169_c0_g1_i1.p1 TRINITY_DN4169_c0_g1~~TRINITY_DN4169_c0_g1_i1.p1  ORF type:complete len:490 (+),score=82.59 TRINITY_DN4169_c0_g1_i1:83-1552(+)
MFPISPRALNKHQQTPVSINIPRSHSKPKFEYDEAEDLKDLEARKKKLEEKLSAPSSPRRLSEDNVEAIPYISSDPKSRSRSPRGSIQEDCNPEDIVSLKSGVPYVTAVETQASYFTFFNFAQPVTDPTFTDLEWSTIHVESKAALDIFASQKVRNPSKREHDKYWHKGERNLNFIVKGKGLWYISMWDARPSSKLNHGLTLSVTLTAQIPKISFSHVTRVTKEPQIYYLMPKVPYHFFSTKARNGTVIHLEGPPEIILCVDSYRSFPNLQRFEELDDSTETHKEIVISGVECSGCTSISVFDPSYRTRSEKKKATFTIWVDKTNAEGQDLQTSRLSQAFFSTNLTATGSSSSHGSTIARNSSKKGLQSAEAPGALETTPKKKDEGDGLVRAHSSRSAELLIQNKTKPAVETKRALYGASKVRRPSLGNTSSEAAKKESQTSPRAQKLELPTQIASELKRPELSPRHYVLPPGCRHLSRSDESASNNTK